MIADYLEEILVEAGYEVCGIAGNVADAIALGERHRPSLGVIDMRLGNGEFGTDVAAALCPRGGFGVLYATGNAYHPMLAGAQGDRIGDVAGDAADLVAGLDQDLLEVVGDHEIVLDDHDFPRRWHADISHKLE